MKTSSRREFLSRAVTTAATFTWLSQIRPLLAGPSKRSFKIGACDWSIGKQADPAAFAVAKEIGLDGVQVSLGTVADNMKLRQADVQQTYLRAAKEQELEIASLAIGEMNNVPYKSDERAEEWVRDSIDVCQALGCSVVLLAFFAKGDVKGDKAGLDEVVNRLRKVAPKAEQAGVKLGFESWLNAAELMEVIDRVGSPALQVYYDVANAHQMGYDIYQEIRSLGRKHICEFHMKENGSLLGRGEIDFKKVRKALDEIGYAGWMQIEGAVPPGKPMLASYQENCAYLRRIFASDT